MRLYISYRVGEYGYQMHHRNFARSMPREKAIAGSIEHAAALEF